MTDFGTDLSCTEDLDPMMREVDGIELVSQGARRRLGTPRGTLIDDPLYGDDVLDSLGDELTETDVGRLPSRIRGELAKDEEIGDVEVTVETTVSGAVSITVLCDTALGPFKFVADVGSVSTIIDETK